MIRSVAVLVVALVLRLAVLGYASRLPLFEHHRLDEVVYDEAGRAIAHGDLALGHEVLHMSPGYSYFVGGVYAMLGDGPWPLRIVQLLLGLGTVALVMGAARRLLGEPWGTLAGAIAALYGPLAFYESVLLDTTLSAFCYALILWLVVPLAMTGRRWVLVGLVLGLAVILRPSALLLAVPLVVMARRPVWIVMLVGAIALVIAPVTLRNWMVAGEPVLVTDSGGLNFFIGNGKGANGTFRIPRDLPDATSASTQFPAFRRLAERHEGHALDSRGVDSFWYRTTWQHIWRTPRSALRLLAWKLELYWNARELANTEDYSFSRKVNPALVVVLGFALVGPLALLGTILLCCGDRRHRLVGALNVVSCLGVVLFFVVGRYRMTAMPGLVIAAVHAAQRISSSRWLIVALGLCAVPVLWPTGLPDAFDDQWFKLGYAYHLRGEVGEAERCYLEAGHNLNAEKNLATLYDTLGHRDEARTVWARLAADAHDAGDTERERLARSHLQ